jgi:hypothetical protein
MGLLTDVFLATESEVLAAPLDNTIPSRLFPTLEGKRLTSLEFTCLQMALQNEDPDALDDETFVTQVTWPTICNWDNEIWVEQIPATFVQALADLDVGELPQVVHRWLMSGQMGRDSGPEAIDWAVPYVRELAQLARQAITSGKALFLWISL